MTAHNYNIFFDVLSVQEEFGHGSQIRNRSGGIYSIQKPFFFLVQTQRYKVANELYSLILSIQIFTRGRLDKKDPILIFQPL